MRKKMYNQLNENQKELWQKLGYKQPTAIQEKVFQAITTGENIIGVSPTGTGKTLAYALPLLTQIESNQTLQLIVLSPSQELAQQIGSVIREWSQNLTVQVLAGGANIKRQIENLKKRPEIIVATPGRLLEITRQSKKIKFHTVKSIVIDEADYLLVDEHLKDTRDIVKKLPSLVQFILFSATKTPRLLETEKWFGKSCQLIDVAQNSAVSHGYIVIDPRKRVEFLRKLAKNNDVYAMVFINNVINVMSVRDKLMYEQVAVSTLNSDMSHIERQKELKQFKDKQTAYLLTSDISTRGIDIDNMPLVIQYDLPWEKDIYTHRSGRTGRMVQEGLVLSLISQAQLKDYLKLVPNKQEVVEYVFTHGHMQPKNMN